MLSESSDYIPRTHLSLQQSDHFQDQCSRLSKQKWEMINLHCRFDMVALIGGRPSFIENTMSMLWFWRLYNPRKYITVNAARISEISTGFMCVYLPVSFMKHWSVSTVFPMFLFVKSRMLDSLAGCLTGICASNFYWIFFSFRLSLIF